MSRFTMNRPVMGNQRLPWLLLALAGCVTINVYFPEAEIRDLSERIEKEVSQKAEETADDAAPPGTAQSGQPPGALALAMRLDRLELFGAGLAAPRLPQEDVPEPEITNPAIRRIIDSRAQRLAQLRRYKDAGWVGENNRAMVEVRDLQQIGSLQDRAAVQRLVKEENADRNQLYREVAAAKGVDAAQIPRVQETYAETIRRLAHPGDWVQQPDGQWVQKR